MRIFEKTFNRRVSYLHISTYGKVIRIVVLSLGSETLQKICFAREKERKNERKNERKKESKKERKPLFLHGTRPSRQRRKFSKVLSYDFIVHKFWRRHTEESNFALPRKEYFLGVCDSTHSFDPSLSLSLFVCIFPAYNNILYLYKMTSKIFLNNTHTSFDILMT